MLDINKQKMIYALKDGRTPVYQLNKDGSIKYIIVDGKTIIDETSCDYIVKGVADEGLTADLFLLQKNVR